MIYLVVYEKDEMVNVEEFRDLVKATDFAETLEEYPLVILRRTIFEDHSEDYYIEGEVVFSQNEKLFKELAWNSKDE